MAKFTDYWGQPDPAFERIFGPRTDHHHTFPAQLGYAELDRIFNLHDARRTEAIIHQEVPPHAWGAGEYEVHDGPANSG